MVTTWKRREVCAICSPDVERRVTLVHPRVPCIGRGPIRRRDAREKRKCAAGFFSPGWLAGLSRTGCGGFVVRVSGGGREHVDVGDAAPVWTVRDAGSQVERPLCE